MKTYIKTIDSGAVVSAHVPRKDGKRGNSSRYAAVRAFGVFFVAALVLFAASSAKTQDWDVPGYADEDGDGINDLFRDADGDGINDVTGKEYRHRYPFIDNDGDGINDVFRDANGDGINDYLVGAGVSGVESERYPVIDFDGDGINDVTGKPVVKKLIIRSFIDENGDGIDDREALAPVRSLFNKIMSDNDQERRVVIESMDGPAMDRFIDENRDGINDGRTINDKLPEALNQRNP